MLNRGVRGMSRVGADASYGTQGKIESLVNEGSSVTGASVKSEVRGELATSFIQQCCAPDKYKTRPAPQMHPAAAIESVDLNGNFNISRTTNQNADSSIVPNASILRNDTGVVLWFPKDSIGSVYHMAIMPKGAISYNINRDIFPDYNNIDSANRTETSWFKYNSALALPYGAGAYEIRQNPPIELKFSSARAYGGYLNIWSNTIGIGSTSLQGTATTAVVSNALDVAQSDDGSTCYAPTAIGTAARNTKERVIETDLAEGVTSLQGPDIPTDYSAPLSLDVEGGKGAWEDLSSQVRGGGNTVQSGLLPGGLNIVFEPTSTLAQAKNQLFSWFLSPWDVEIIPNTADTCVLFPDQQIHNIKASKIPEQSFLRVKGTMPIDIKLQDSIPNGDDRTALMQLGIQFTVLVEHMFARVQEDGSVVYNEISDVFTKSGIVGDFIQIRNQFPTASNGLRVPNIPAGGTTPQINNLFGSCSLDFDSDPKSRFAEAGGTAVLGKYIGSRVLGGYQAGDTFYSGPGNPGNIFMYMRLYLGQAKLNVLCPDYYNEGKTGPVHVLRYDNVAEKQNIRIQGVLNTEAVPNSSVSYLTQASVMFSKMSMDPSSYSLLYALFNGDHPQYKCSWVQEEYLQWVKDHVSHLTPANLLEEGRGNERTTAAVEAAGLGHFLGGLGGSLGTLAGEALGDVFSHGQFGVSPASWNQAGGHYNGARRPR